MVCDDSLFALGLALTMVKCLSWTSPEKVAHIYVYHVKSFHLKVDIVNSPTLHGTGVLCVLGLFFLTPLRSFFLSMPIHQYCK